MASVWTAVKARKIHRCAERRTGCTNIHPGMTYMRVVIFPNDVVDEITVEKICGHCLTVREREY
jgi:hypothetical protein